MAVSRGTVTPANGEFRNPKEETLMPDSASWDGHERRQNARLRQIVDDLQERLADLETRMNRVSMQSTLIFDTVAQLRRDIHR